VQTLKTAVIGLGIGKHHAMVLSEMEGTELVAVADLKKDITTHLSDQLDVNGYLDGMQLLEEEPLDFVCICLPPAMHLRFTREASKRGIHVFCEKPMAPTLADCDGMIEACRSNEVKLMIGQKKRFSPAFQFIKNKTEGDFGPIRWASLRYACGQVGMDWFWDEEDGGGPLLENSVHAFDMLRYLIGEVDRVYAEGGNAFNPGRAPQLDTAAVSIRFKNDAVASVAVGQAWEWGFAQESSYFAHDEALVELTGTFDNPEHLHYVLRSDPEETIKLDRPEHDLFQLELDHFAQCIRGGTRPLVTGREGRRSIAVCLAVKESVRTGEPIAPE
jgi:predicted dehydrogenase